MLPPFQLGAYKVIGQVGSGGFATVFKAVVEGDMGFSRDVALKVLHSHITTTAPDVVTMLADDARLLARMQHPNIVYVQWFGKLRHPTEGEVFAMTMEYVEGRSWRSILQEQRKSDLPIPLSVVVDLHVDVARALEFAHGLRDNLGQPLGLVHRDLKPDNIMVSSQGIVKLLDFGIAKARDRLAQATATNLVRGTVHYMSPEQVYGAKDLDFRSDLFSFGAMLYEAATSKRMITADTVVPAVREISEFDPAPAIDHATSIHPELGGVLTKLLAPDRKDRYGSTSELVSAMQSLRGKIETETPTTLWLSERALPIGDTAFVETPRDLRASGGPAGVDSETVDISTGGFGDFPPTTPLDISAGSPVVVGATVNAPASGPQPTPKGAT